MFLITKYGLQTSFSQLLSSLQQLPTTSDLLTFYLLIGQIRTLVSDLEIKVRKENCRFGSQLPSMLLISIFSFLPGTCYRAHRRTCRRWLQNLRSVHATNILSILPKCGLEISETLPFQGITSAAIMKENIALQFTSWRLPLSDRKWKIVSMKTLFEPFQPSWAAEARCVIYDNQFFVFAPSNSISVYDAHGSFLRSWKSELSFSAAPSFTIDDGKIYLSSNLRTIVYSFDGVLIGKPNFTRGKVLCVAKGKTFTSRESYNGVDLYISSEQGKELSTLSFASSDYSVLNWSATREFLVNLSPDHRKVHLLDHQGHLLFSWPLSEKVESLHAWEEGICLIYSDSVQVLRFV